MSEANPIDPELADQLNRALSRLRVECRRVQQGQSADLDGAFAGLSTAIAGIEHGLSNDDEQRRRLITNTICELEATRSQLADELESTADDLRAAQGQRRAMSAYAKANRR